MIKIDKGQPFEKVQKQKAIYFETLTNSPIHFHPRYPQEAVLESLDLKK